MRRTLISEASNERAAGKRVTMLGLAATSTHLQSNRAPHAIQDDFLRVALWYLMGGAAAESIMAAQEQRPAA